MSLNDYKNMNYDIKKRVLSGIYENRESLSKKLNVNISSNPATKRANSITYKNQNNKMNRDGLL